MTGIGGIWDTLLAAASLVAGATLLVAALRRPADRTSGSAHALMGVGMADMFAPWGGLLPATAGATLFAVIAAWFAAAALRHTGPVRGSAVHLAVSPAAMAVMYLGTGGGPGPDPGGSAHAGHGASMASDAGSPLLTVLIVALAGYFVWYAWTLAAPGSESSATGAARVTAPTVTAPTGERIAHITMCALMATMFLGTV